MQLEGCTTEPLDPRCNCKTGHCGGCKCGKLGSVIPRFGDSRYNGCQGIISDCDCKFYYDDDSPPEYLCPVTERFEHIEDGRLLGQYGSNCAREMGADRDPNVCTEGCMFNDEVDHPYCQSKQLKRNIRFEEIRDGDLLGQYTLVCPNGGREDEGTCREPCDPGWLEEREELRRRRCKDWLPFELAPDGYLIRMDLCKGSHLYVYGWCRHKQRRPGYILCGGTRLYHKWCQRWNLCGGLRVSY